MNSKRRKRFPPSTRATNR